MWLIETLRNNPSIAIFFTIGVGFLIGKLKYKSFSLGTVTSVLLVGVVVGQLDIPISGPLKQIFFLLFLFAIGYSVGPQFFRALKGSGIKQVIFACVMCVLCLMATIGTAKLFGYNLGESIGLFAGAQSISSVIGVGEDCINTMSGVDPATKQSWINIIPVCYAVTYIFGTIGSAWILGSLGPLMLGGTKKCRRETAELAAQLNNDNTEDDPGHINALRPVVYRAYKVTSSEFSNGLSVADIENKIRELGRVIYVERLRINGLIINEFNSETKIHTGDEIVLSGRREYIIEDESWIGPETADIQLLSFPVAQIPVVIAKKESSEITVSALRAKPYMTGVVIAAISRGGVAIPVMAKTELYAGDIITLNGQDNDINTAIKHIGYPDRPTNVTDMVFVGLGICIGALIGAVTLHLGGIPVSLSTSGGALIAGLVLGWLRSKHPTFGHIPQSSVWILNNLGLNMFIAVIGITSGPSFISGLMQVGWMLLVAGIIATTVPLVLGIWIGAKIFKFPAAINLGCCAGARTTTASLGAIQDALDSSIPAMGYTVTYAIGNTLLIFMGVIMATIL